MSSETKTACQLVHPPESGHVDLDSWLVQICDRVSAKLDEQAREIEKLTLENDRQRTALAAYMATAGGEMRKFMAERDKLRKQVEAADRLVTAASELAGYALSDLRDVIASDGRKALAAYEEAKR